MDEKKNNLKLAVVVDNYTRGGVAMALQTFLQFLAEYCDITLFVRDYDESSMLPIPDGVTCCPWMPEQTLSPCNRLFAMLSWRNFGRRAVYQTRCRQMFPGEYDCAIAYQMVTNSVTVVTLEKIRAKRKILWLHGKKNFKEKDLAFYDALYSKADRIVCVSLETESRFQSLMPKCADKTVTIHNFYDIPYIRQQAQLRADDMNKTPNAAQIVSVGRLSKEKGFDRVPAVARKLTDAGYNFCWHIIGDGDRREALEAEIKKEKVDDFVHLLGYRQNPFSYVQQCDIYVQPSYTEGFCTSTMEAKILFKPVVTTEVPGMREQFVSGENGLIVESSVDGICNGIKQLLDNPDLVEKIIRNLRAEPITNVKVLRQTMNVINGV